MKHHNHIVFLCSRLNLPGGIERAIVNTANLLQSNGYRITLLVLDATDHTFYPLNKEIQVITAPLHFGITRKGNVVTRKFAFYKHIRKLKQLIDTLQPNAIIGTEYVFSIAAKLSISKTAVKIFSWEHHHFNHLQKSRFWQLLSNKVYPLLDAVICLNEDEAKYFERTGCKAVVIPNFIDKNDSSLANHQNKQLLTVGWLNKTKGADLIPSIAERVFSKHPDWKWKIIGAGKEEEALKQHSDRIELIKPTSPHLEQLYLDSSIYVLPSRFECFPMVLLEAMASGVAAVAFDCPTGPRHIIKNGEDGLLVESGNINAMAGAICSLIEDKERRQQMGIRAAQNIQRFSACRAYSSWKAILKNV